MSGAYSQGKFNCCLSQELSNEFKWEYSKLWFSILNKDGGRHETVWPELGCWKLIFCVGLYVTGQKWEAIMSGIQKTKWTNSEVI